MSQTDTAFLIERTHDLNGDAIESDADEQFLASDERGYFLTTDHDLALRFVN